MYSQFSKITHRLLSISVASRGKGKRNVIDSVRESEKAEWTDRKHEKYVRKQKNVARLPFVIFISEKHLLYLFVWGLAAKFLSIFNEKSARYFSTEDYVICEEKGPELEFFYWWPIREIFFWSLDLRIKKLFGIFRTELIFKKENYTIK